MSGDGIPWRSGAAENDDVGFSLVKRDIEVLMLTVQKLASATGVSVDGQPQNALQSAAPGAPGRDGVNGADGYSPAADGPTTLLGDVQGPSNANTVLALGGIPLGGSLSSDQQALLYNQPSNYWEPVTLIASTGGILSKDTGGLIEIDASAATSVFGNATGSAAAPAAIVASANNLVLGRRSGVLTWDKVARAEMANGTACSVLGRYTNSDGVLADIVSATAHSMLVRGSTYMAWAPATQARRALIYSGTDIAWRAFAPISAVVNITTGSFTVGATQGLFRFIISGGGGGGGGASAQAVVGYIASSSGGAATSALYAHQYGGGGGAGCFMVIDIALPTGALVEWTIGAGGTAGSASGDGGDGGNTIVKVNGSTYFVAGGGSGGKADGSAGAGGVPTWTYGAEVGFAITAKGTRGVRAVYRAAPTGLPPAEGGLVHPSRGVGGRADPSLGASSGIPGLFTYIPY